MTQVLFAAQTSPLETDLDANFTELYGKTQLLFSTSTALGFGVNPSAWGSAYRPIQAAAGAFWSFSTSAVGVVANAYDSSGGTWKYLNAGAAQNFTMNPSGGFMWSAASSGAAGAAITFGTVLTLDTAGVLKPGADNSQTLGAASLRWSTVYAGTGTINTSDAREKTPVTPLADAEVAAAMALAQSIGTYQWLDAIQAKGEGDARKHVGLTVQSAIAIMTAHGLDPMAYGFICYDSWLEEKDEDGNVTLAAGDRYSFRPDELGMFIARGVATTLAAIDARLAAHGI